MKKTTIFLAILSIGLLFSCTKEEDLGKEKPLRLKPNKLVFEHKNDTMIVSAISPFLYLGPSLTTTKKTYFSSHQDTVYDGWIKAVASKDRMQVKVIVYDNDTEFDRYYEIDVMGMNSGEIIQVIQRQDEFRFSRP